MFELQLVGPMQPQTAKSVNQHKVIHMLKTQDLKKNNSIAQSLDMNFVADNMILLCQRRGMSDKYYKT